MACQGNNDSDSSVDRSSKTLSSTGLQAPAAIPSLNKVSNDHNKDSIICHLTSEPFDFTTWFYLLHKNHCEGNCMTALKILSVLLDRLNKFRKTTQYTSSSKSTKITSSTPSTSLKKIKRRVVEQNKQLNSHPYNSSFSGSNSRSSTCNKTNQLTMTTMEDSGDQNEIDSFIEHNNESDIKDDSMNPIKLKRDLSKMVFEILFSVQANDSLESVSLSTVIELLEPVIKSYYTNQNIMASLIQIFYR